MNKIGPINSSRINYVSIRKNQSTESIKNCEKITPINKAVYTDKDDFYYKLQNAKDKLNHTNKNTTNNSNNKDSNTKNEKECLEYLESIKNLVKQYNNAIFYIHKAFESKSTTYLAPIIHILLENEFKLSLIGITRKEDFSLYLDERKFRLSFNKNLHFIHSCFDLEVGLIKKLYNEFKLIYALKLRNF